MKHTISRRRLFFTKNLIMMLVMVVVLGISVFSWFTIYGHVYSDGMSVKAKSGDVQIALPYHGSYPDDSISTTEKNNGHRFMNEIDFNISEQMISSDSDSSNAFLDLFRDTTSDGSLFINPSFNGHPTIADGKVVNDEAAFTLSQSNKDVYNDGNEENDKALQYLDMDFYLRSEDKNIQITEDSFLTTLSEANGFNLKDDNLDSQRISTAGSDTFSSDALAGAIRVSLSTKSITAHTVDHTDSNNITYYTDNVPSGETEQLRFLWIPRPDLYIQTAGRFPDWRLTTGVCPLSSGSVNPTALKTYRHTFYSPDEDNWSADPPIYKGVTKKIYYDSHMKSDYNLTDAQFNQFKDGATTEDYFFVSKVDTSNPTAVPKLGHSHVVCDSGLDANRVLMKNSADEDTYYFIYKCSLKIWIEGEDAEARRAMNNGAFRIQLEFKG